MRHDMPLATSFSTVPTRVYRIQRRALYRAEDHGLVRADRIRVAMRRIYRWRK
jgi:hypothetical protein